MLRMVQHRADRTLTLWRALIFARGGPLGAAQTLGTLLSLTESWTGRVDQWDVVLVAPPDEHLHALVESLDGDLEVVWGSATVETLTAAARRAGRQPHLFFAGDAVTLPEWRPPLRIPLVDPDRVVTTGWSVDGSTAPGDLVVWQRDTDPDVHQPLAVFVGSSVGEARSHRSAYRIAWLHLPAALDPEPLECVRREHRTFDLVIVCDASDAEGLPRTAVVPRAGTTLSLDEQRIGAKSRLLSMVVPPDAPEAVVRLAVAAGADLYSASPATTPSATVVSSVGPALNSYRYSVVVEGSRHPDYFSERLVDCLRSGTVPVLQGLHQAGAHFDVRGLLRFEGVEDLPAVLHGATEEHHGQLLQSVESNFHAAQAWTSRERLLYDVLEPYVRRAAR